MANDAENHLLHKRGQCSSNIDTLIRHTINLSGAKILHSCSVLADFMKELFLERIQPGINNRPK